MGGLFLFYVWGGLESFKGCGESIFPLCWGNSEAKWNAKGAKLLWGAMLSDSEAERQVPGRSLESYSESF